MKRGFPIVATSMAILTALILGTGCISLKLVSVDQKTQLENQILGSFGELQKDLVLVQSVRGESDGEPALPPAAREALQAMLNRQFNADDVAELKAQGIACEKRNGLLQFVDTERTRDDADTKARAQALIAEENRDREIFMKRVIALNPNLSQKDYPAVGEMMFKLNLEGSAPGTRYEGPDGAWLVKAASAKAE